MILRLGSYLQEWSLIGDWFVSDSFDPYNSFDRHDYYYYYYNSYTAQLRTVKGVSAIPPGKAWFTRAT